MKSKPIRLTKVERRSNSFVEYGHSLAWYISPEDIQSVEVNPDHQIGSCCVVHAFGEKVPVQETWAEIDRLLGTSTTVEEPQ